MIEIRRLFFKPTSSWTGDFLEMDWYPSVGWRWRTSGMTGFVKCRKSDPEEAWEKCKRSALREFRKIVASLEAE